MLPIEVLNLLWPSLQHNQPQMAGYALLTESSTTRGVSRLSLKLFQGRTMPRQFQTQDFISSIR